MKIFGIRTSMSTDENVVAQIGLSLEPLDVIQQQQQNISSQMSFESGSMTSVSSTNPPLQPSEMMIFAQKMLENMFNYVMSFEKPMSMSMMKPSDVIPTEALKKWYTVFESKIQKDPYFWKNSS